jgi:hypothetical protein
MIDPAGIYIPAPAPTLKVAEDVPSLATPSLEEPKG